MDVCAVVEKCDITTSSVLLLFFPSRRKVFSYSPGLDLLSRTFFGEVFFRQKSPGSPDGPHKKLRWKHGVNQFTTSWKAFPPNWFFLNQSCVVCALQFNTREIVFSWAGLVLWLLLTGNLLRDWNLMCSHFFPFSGGRWNSHPALLPLSYMCLKIPPLLLDVNPQKSFPISVNFFVPQEYCFHSSVSISA